MARGRNVDDLALGNKAGQPLDGNGSLILFGADEECGSSRSRDSRIRRARRLPTQAMDHRPGNRRGVIPERSALARRNGFCLGDEFGERAVRPKVGKVGEIHVPASIRTRASVRSGWSAASQWPTRWAECVRRTGRRPFVSGCVDCDDPRVETVGKAPERSPHSQQRFHRHHASRGESVRRAIPTTGRRCCYRRASRAPLARAARRAPAPRPCGGSRRPRADASPRRTPASRTNASRPRGRETRGSRAARGSSRPRAPRARRRAR